MVIKSAVLIARRVPRSNASCGYTRGHPELRAEVKARIKANRSAMKQAREQKEALLAGMKAPTSTEFSQLLQQKLEEAGLDR